MSDLYKFSYFVPSRNYSGAINRPISSDSNNPSLLASIYFPTDLIGSVWLTSTVGWRANTGTVSILFKIWKDTAVIASGVVGGESCCERNYVFNLSHVDTIGPENTRNHVYYLTAEVLNPNASAYVIGPLTFTAAEITERVTVDVSEEDSL